MLKLYIHCLNGKVTMYGQHISLENEENIYRVIASIV